MYNSCCDRKYILYGHEKGEESYDIQCDVLYVI